MAQAKGRNFRGILLSPSGKVLLMKMAEPRTGHQFWICPGGTAEDGESGEECLRRELLEETGYAGGEIGPVLWEREYSYTCEDERVHQDEQYFLVRTQEFEATMAGNPEALEITAFQGFRWWDVEEICLSEEEFGPALLGSLGPWVLVGRSPGERTP